jgi:hypothetical protein
MTAGSAAIKTPIIPGLDGRAVLLRKGWESA